MGVLDFLLHFDTHLADFVRDYGSWVYAILFTIVFAETGFVVTPFLPAIRCCSRPARSAREAT